MTRTTHYEWRACGRKQAVELRHGDVFLDNGRVARILRRDPETPLCGFIAERLDGQQRGQTYTTEGYYADETVQLCQPVRVLGAPEEN